jgi:ATP-binding cassette subfamily B protein
MERAAVINEAAAEEHPALRDLPLLGFLPPEVRRQMVERFVPAAYPFGSVIVREGEPADAFYVLVSGRARVVNATEGGEEIALNSLRPGDSFGEDIPSVDARTAISRSAG